MVVCIPAQMLALVILKKIDGAVLMITDTDAEAEHVFEFVTVTVTVLVLPTALVCAVLLSLHK